jgi:glycosyltransferase involved in cell wall biosynthesis
MKVALVHDYLTEMGGAERVALALTRIFSEAPLYTSVYDQRACAEFADRDVRTTFMQRLTRRKAVTKGLFPLFPAAFRRLDLRSFDVIVSSSSGFAHHVCVPDGAVHVCYCHNTPRFLWQPDDYFRGRLVTRRLLGPALSRLRKLDLEAARRVDAYVANSATVAERISDKYGLRAEIFHPPVDTSRFEVTDERSGRFLVVARLLAYKRVDLAVEAATTAGLPLDVIGEGPERRRLERLAGPTVHFLGRQGDEFVRHRLARCTALLVPGTEDFGLTPVEAQASGRPPVAFAAGGALETVLDGTSGFLFQESTPTSLVAAMRRAMVNTLPARQLRAWAEGFDTRIFASRFESFVCDQARSKELLKRPPAASRR